jgi:hypothetical protein
MMIGIFLAVLALVAITNTSMEVSSALNVTSVVVGTTLSASDFRYLLKCEAIGEHVNETALPFNINYPFSQHGKASGRDPNSDT